MGFLECDVVNKIAVIGAGGAIGHAFVDLLARRFPTAQILACSHAPLHTDIKNVTWQQVNYRDEISFATAAKAASEFDLVIIACGILHNNNIMPEKALRDLSTQKFEHVFAANTIAPALAIKHFGPRLRQNHRAVLAALSARIGSISDNKIGGWYSYRASKAALNMIIKTASIELGRTHPEAIIVGLHPGTVNSTLSKPFQSHIPKDKLFEPEFSAVQLMTVIEALKPVDSGHCFAWDGTHIAP